MNLIFLNAQNSEIHRESGTICQKKSQRQQKKHVRKISLVKWSNYSYVSPIGSQMQVFRTLKLLVNKEEVLRFADYNFFIQLRNRLRVPIRIIFYEKAKMKQKMLTLIRDKQKLVFLIKNQSQFKKVHYDWKNKAVVIWTQ